MDTLQVYVSIRSDIIVNHALIQWFTLIVAIAVVVGTTVVEQMGKTILSVFLPLLSLAWAASVVRFDYFIHREAAYLRTFETNIQPNLPNLLLWETYKSSLHSTVLVVPLLDVIAVSVIIIPTLYLLFVPAQDYFRARSWRGGKLYAYTISVLLILLLFSIAAVPKIASS